jgi:hypothetical protein
MKAAMPLLFAANPAAAQAYETLATALGKIGPYTVEEKKTSLHIVAGRAAFLGVHPRKNGLRLNIVLSRELHSDRIVKLEQPSKTTFHNEIELRAGEDIDGELEAWIQEAYHRVGGS